MSEPSADELKLQLARMRAVLEGIPAAVLVGDRRRVLVDLNRRACELLGYYREELLGKPIAIIHVESEMALYEELYGRGLRGEPYTVQYMLLRKDGRQVPVELRCDQVEVAGETLMVAIVQETTQRESMLRDIVKQERAGAVATLAEGVAHEFNNLLARILASAEESSEVAFDLTVRRNLSTIIQAAEEGGQIAERLLSYARRRPIEPRPVNLISIIEHAFQIMEEDLVAAKINVFRDFEPLPMMMLDNAQIGQVFMNLISNARDAMPEGGTLHVSVRRAGDEAVVRVTDTGPGIPPEILGDLFKPFVTTKGARGAELHPGHGARPVRLRRHPRQSRGLHLRLERAGKGDHVHRSPADHLPRDHSG